METQSGCCSGDTATRHHALKIDIVGEVIVQVIPSKSGRALMMLVCHGRVHEPRLGGSEVWLPSEESAMPCRVGASVPRLDNASKWRLILSRRRKKGIECA